MAKAGVTALGIGAAIAIAASGAKAAEMTKLERGQYLVTSIGNCGDCHTPGGHGPNDPLGAPLSGAKLSFEPIHPPPNWAGSAPPIAGLPAGRSEIEIATLLETGAYPSGARLRPPMPKFHMTKADAQAVAAYLASLKP